MAEVHPDTGTPMDGLAAAFAAQGSDEPVTSSAPLALLTGLDDDEVKWEEWE